MITIDVATPGSAPADAIVRAYLADVVARYHGRPATDAEVDATLRDEPYDDLQGATGTVLLARQDGLAVGCAGIRVRGDGAELTKVFTLESCRGRGVATELLAHLEQHARDRGARVARLDTRSDLVEACALYERRGYARVPAYSVEPYSDRWYAKAL